MINKANYYSEINRIGLKNLPVELQEMHDLINDLTESGANWSAYDSDKDLQEYAGVQFSKVQEWIDKNETSKGPKTEPNPEKEIAKSKTIKMFNTQYNVGKAKYIVNYHDGIKKNEDGSNFFDMKIFKNKKDFSAFINKLKNDNYIYDGYEIEKAKPKKEKEVKPKKEKQPKESKEKPSKPQPTETESIDIEIRLIKRFVAMNGKRVGKHEIMQLLKALQQAILTKAIRKTSNYAADIMDIQKFLVATYNGMDATVKIEIDEKRLIKFAGIGSSKKIMPVIMLIKRFLALYPKITKPQGRDDAKRLQKQIEDAVSNGKVPETNPYYTEMEFIYHAVTQYAAGKPLKIKDYQLSGLRGVCSCLDGLGRIDKKKVKEHVVRVSKNPFPYVGAFAAGVLSNLAAGLIADSIKPKPTTALSGVVSSENLQSMKFDLIGLSGKYGKLIGNPEKGFSALVHGLPKSGKSTLCIDFAKHLAENNGKVLYVAIEEGYGYTLQEKFQRMKAFVPNLSISNKLLKSYAGFDFVFIDSISKAGLDADTLEKIKKENPNTAFIFIFHSTKNGNFRGSQQFAHDQDVIIEVAGGIAKANGRFAPENEMNIFENSLSLS